MYLDPNSHGGVALADELIQCAQELKVFQIIAQLKPKLSQDGNQYCYLLGELPNDCCVGYGDTVAKAAYDFVNNLWNNKTVSEPVNK